MEEKKYRIPLFDGTNYPDWKFRMEAYLDELDLVAHIENPLRDLLAEHEIPETMTPDERMSIEKTRQQIIKNDKKCKSRIIQCIQDTQLEVVKGKETAYEAWKNLQDVFEKRGMTSHLLLRKKLLTMKYRPSMETLREYFLKFDKIIRELQGTGAEIEETDKICHLF
jgi:hypothetical protein